MVILELKNCKKVEQCSLESLSYRLVSGGLSRRFTVEKRVLVFLSPVLMMFAQKEVLAVESAFL